MTGLALALALAAQQPLGPWLPLSSPATSVWNGRVYTSATLHVGLRPAVYVTSEDRERAAGVTLQVSAW